MGLLENFIPVTVMLTLSMGLLFSSFFSTKPRFPKKTHFLWMYLAVIPYYVINQHVNQSTTGFLRPVYNFLSILLLLSCVQFFYEGKAYQKGLVSILFIVFTITGEWLMAVFARAFLSVAELQRFISEGKLGNRLAMLLTLLLIFSMWSARRKRGLSVQRNFSIIQLLIALSCSFALGLLVTGVTITDQFLLRDFLLMGALGLLLLLFYIGFEMSNNMAKKNQEYQLQQQRHELLEDYYQQVEKHQQEVRQIKHDLKNQLYSVVGYLNANKDEVANEQINELINQLESNELPSFTRHTGLNALLRLHFQRIQLAGITCEFDIKCPESMGFSDTDISSLIGNILDNAREACEHCDTHKYIQLKIVYFNHSLVVSCENSTEKKVTSFITRKQDKDSHGIGTRAIRQIVEAYHGSLNHRIDDYSFKLTLSLFEQT